MYVCKIHWKQKAHWPKVHIVETNCSIVLSRHRSSTFHRRAFECIDIWLHASVLDAMHSIWIQSYAHTHVHTRYITHAVFGMYHLQLATIDAQLSASHPCRIDKAFKTTQFHHLHTRNISEWCLKGSTCHTGLFFGVVIYSIEMLPCSKFICYDVKLSCRHRMLI